MANRNSMAIRTEQGMNARNVRWVVQLRAAVYRNDSSWVAPLTSQIKSAYSRTHPYLRRGKCELFIILLGQTPVAAALAFFDPVSATACGSTSAYFCGFECIDDLAVADRLFTAIEDWAMEQGAVELIGPMSPRLSDTRGVLIEGAGPPVFGMAYSPPYYDALFSGTGFQKATDLFEFIVTSKPAYPRLERIGELARRRFPTLALRPFDLTQMKREITTMSKIYNAAWKSNWGFMPMDVGDFVHAAAGLKRILGPACAYFVEIDGQPVGFQIVVPNVNAAFKAINSRLWPFGFLKLKRLVAREKAFRAMFIGVLPQFRKTGIEAILIKAGLATGAEKFHIGWVLESNFAWKNEIENITGNDLRFKKYRIYRRACEEQHIEQAA